MKAAILSAIIVLLCTTSLPLMLVKNEEAKSVMAEVFDMEEMPLDISDFKNSKDFKIKFTKTGEIKTVSAEDYVIGVLCGEISPSYSKEAIKAQAVAAYTFALYRSAKAEALNRNFDLTDSPETDQCYIPKAGAYEKWGENADKYYKIFADAVKEVSGEAVLYNSAPALTVYHAVSSGMTNSAKDVWGSDVPYLCSVESVGDKLCKNYLSEVTISETEVAEKLKDKCSISAGSNAFGDIKTAQSGRVLSVAIGKDKISGGDIAAALSLKSANFEVAYSGGNYTFTVKGSGHGVGMSQQGAEYMAKQGSNYEEILLHYYKGCTLKK